MPACSKCNRKKYKNTIEEWAGLKAIRTKHENGFSFISALVVLSENDHAEDFSDVHLQEQYAVLTALQSRMQSLKEDCGYLCNVGENPTGETLQPELVTGGLSD